MTLVQADQTSGRGMIRPPLGQCWLKLPRPDKVKQIFNWHFQATTTEKRKNWTEDREKKCILNCCWKEANILITYYYAAVIYTSFYRNKISGIALSCLISIVSGNHKALPQSLPEISEKNETSETEILKKSGKNKWIIQTWK